MERGRRSIRRLADRAPGYRCQMTNYDRDKLIELIRSEAIEFGEFTLASGQKSPYYIDCRRVTLCSAGASLIAAGILKLLDQEPFDAIGGLTLGADPIVGAVLRAAADCGRDLRGFLVRKEAKGHGTGKRIEGPLRAGDRVVIVEDVTTTGGSALQAIEAVESAGACVVRIVAVLDRLAGARDAFAAKRVPFSTLLTIRDLGLQ